MLRLRPMNRNSRFPTAFLTTAHVIVSALAISILMPAIAHAQKETIVYSFETQGGDGVGPIGGVITDPKGNIYGTTSAGGTNNKGTVFEISGGKERILWNFGGPGDGAQPYGNLVRDAAGHLFGTTLTGGSLGLGTVFEITGLNKETVLVSFVETNGALPFGGLVRDRAGNLYGVTSSGGTRGLGLIFEVSSSGTFSILYQFTGAPDGAIPEGSLLLDSKGNLFGLTAAGGTGKQSFCTSGCGTVFEYSASKLESVLYSFTGGADGATPAGGAFLINDAKGNLFGTTTAGGTVNSACPTTGCGVVFEVSGTSEKVLYAFQGQPNNNDGANPYSGLIRDGKGNLYGTTINGGINGHGVLYEITTAGAEKILHSFPAQVGDGVLPLSSIVPDGNGGGYGTTEGGGQFGGGTVYDIAP